MRAAVSENGYVGATVTGGKIRGVSDGVVATYLGIPYGASTAGDNRYRPPQPVATWDGVRDALQVGRICPQVPLADSLQLRADVWDALEMEAVVSEGCADRDNMGEDCLNLNIWAPAPRDGARHPVMVWLHGGGLTSGGANLRRTEGYNLAKRGDVIVVAINHRLGAFGYLHLAPLCSDPEVASAGNNGMLDIVQALEWIKANIAELGGDPERVTVFGYSGGGFKVCALLGMPAANGLFHRAIVQSGFFEGADAAAGTEVARRLLGHLKVAEGDIAALRAVPADEIVRAQQEMGGVYAGFANVIDGTTLPAMVSESIRAGTTGQVPLIAGYTREEASVFLAHTPGYGLLDWDALPMALGDTLGDRAADAVAVYRAARPDHSPTRIMAGILSDTMFGAPGRRIVEAHAADPARRTWAYVSTWTSSTLPDIWSGHGIEETLYFDNAEAAGATRSAPDAAALAHALSDAWVAFARDGAPVSTALPEWPAFNPTERTTMIVDSPCEAVKAPFRMEDAFWSAA